MPKKEKDNIAGKVSFIAEKSMIEKYAPDEILKMIEENKVSYEDITASYDFYFRVLKFIDLNFETHLKYDLPLLSDMHKIGDYSNYLESLDLLGIDYRSLFSDNK